MLNRFHLGSAIFTVWLAGTTTLLGQVASPLRGMTVSQYAMDATASLESPSSLSFTSVQNSSPGGMNPSFIAGVATGDGIEGTDWSLAAGALNLNGLLGTLWNVVLVETSMVNGASHTIGDTVSATFTLVFSDSQRFFGRVPNAGVDLDTATLTATGSGAIDLTAVAMGTTFTAGTYTLVMAGTVNATYTGGSASVGFSFTNVPGGGGAALLGAMLVARRRRR